MGHVLKIITLTIGSMAWLLAATLLTLNLFGRLPQAGKGNPRASRIQLTALLALTTASVLSAAGALAGWASPILAALAILTFLTAVGALAATIKAATIWSDAKRPQAAAEANGPARSPGTAAGE